MILNTIHRALGARFTDDGLTPLDYGDIESELRSARIHTALDGRWTGDACLVAR